MIIKRDISLKDFKFWSGAKDTANYLSDEDLDYIEDILNSDVAIEFTETEINEFFWFERDVIAEWLGYKDFDELLEYRG